MLCQTDLSVEEVPVPTAEAVLAPDLGRRAEPTTWSLRTSFGLVVAAQVLLFAGSNLPTPLFPIYEQRYSFGSGVVTLLFAVYVGVLIPALIVLGPATDRIGRRPLLVVGIALTVLSSAAFVTARGVAWLFAGEIIYGIGSAFVMSCVSVAIRELHPKQDVAGAALAASVAMAAGLTVGPLVSGILASATPWPTVSPYVLDMVLAALLAAALLRIPETRTRAITAGTRVRAIHVPAEIRRAFAGPASAGAASFMMVGWVFALSPSFLHEVLGIHITRPLVGGLFAALVVFTNGAAQLVLRRHHGRGPTTVALCCVVLGMGIVAVAGVATSLAVAIVGGVIAGAGAGVAQMNAMAAVQHLAPTHTRGSVVSTYVTLCYLALSLPVIVAGAAADRFGLGVVTAWYFLGLALLVAVALLLSHRAEHDSSPS